MNTYRILDKIRELLYQREKKGYSLFSFLLIFSLLNLETNSAQTKYSKLIKAREYEQAVKIIDRKLSKSPNDVLLNYEKANLLTNRRYKNYGSTPFCVEIVIFAP